MARLTSSTRSRPPLGQNFLIDKRIQERIISVVRPSPSSVILEIGGGPGNMTALLAERAARIVTVEVDPKLAAGLREQFAGNDHIEVIEADIMTFPMEKLEASIGGPQLLVFGNLPYYITTPILMKLFEHHQQIMRIIVMMQYEVAQRIVAQAGAPEYGLLSVTSQYYTEPRIEFSIPPGAFNPPPKVVSALVTMQMNSQGQNLGITDEPDFWCWMRAAFASRRKTLLNNWKRLAAAQLVVAELREQNFDDRIRAEDLSLRELAQLYKGLRGKLAAPGN